jgi:hypothetical protein
MERDLTYFTRRASQERTAALLACDPRARQAHLSMASRYDDLVGSVRSNKREMDLLLIEDRLSSPAFLTGLREEGAVTGVVIPPPAPIAEFARTRRLCWQPVWQKTPFGGSRNAL